MEIIRGKLPGAKKVVLYGPEGIGKSTFASQFPDPLFIDTEGSTKDMEVARTPSPSSWTMLMEQVAYVREHPDLCRTLVIDTADWAELLCSESICSKSQKGSIEDFGYGKGYTYLQEEFGRLLNRLEEVVKKGIHVVLTAHAKMRKFEQPDELGAYDRWEMKLTKQVAPMVKEWADMVLFANYKTYVINVDGQGAQKGKNKAQGGKRVLYTTHHSCWDAKNRYGLPDEVPFEYASIAAILEPGKPEGNLPPKEPTPQQPESTKTEAIGYRQTELPFLENSGRRVTPSQTPPAGVMDAKPEPVKDPSAIEEGYPDTIPKALRDLMDEYHVDEWDIQNVVPLRGYYPEGTLIENYDPDFIDGVLVTAWSQVYDAIKEMKEKEEIPFH